MANEKVIGFKIQVQGSETVVKSIKELEDAVKNTNKQLKETDVGSEEYKKLSKELAEAKARLQSVRQEQRAQVREAQGVQAATGSYRQLNAELVALRRQFKELSAVERESAVGEEITGRIQELDAQLRALDTTIGQSQRNVGNYQSAFDGLGSKVSGFVASLPALAIGAITAAIGSGVVAVRELTEEFTELRGAVEQLTGATGDELDEYTSRIAAISNTFGEETDEILQAANALSKQLGIDFSEALTAVEEGFIAGTNANGEFLDSLSEYSTQAQAAGLTTEEFINILNTSATEGVFSDKGIDTVKEFGLRIREQTKPTREALENAFGAEFTDNIFENINSGAITTTQALKQVATELTRSGIPANQLQTVLADVFGGAGEDAGIAFIQSLKDIGTSFDDLAAGGGEFAERQRSILELNQQLTTAQNELTKELTGSNDQFQAIGLQIKTVLVEGLVQAIRNIKFLVTGFVDLFKGVQGFVSQTPILQKALGFIQRSIRFVFTPVRLLLSVFTADFPAAFAGFRAALGQTVENIKIAFQGLVQTAQITGLRLRRALSVRAATRDALTEQIEELRRQRSVVASEGQGIGEAFNQAYTEALEKAQAERAAAALPEPQVLEQFNVAGEKAGEEFSDGLNKALKEGAQEQQKEVQERINTEVSALESKAAKEVELTKNTQDLINQAQENALTRSKEIIEEDLEATRRAEEEKRELRQQRINAGIEAAQLLADTAFIIQANNAKREEEQTIKGLDAQLAAELAAAGKNEKRKAEIEAKFAKKRDTIDKQFRQKEKRRAIAQALINGALAATKTLATLGLPAAILPLIAVGLQTAANVAIISSQQFRKGGILNGPSHERGGIPVRLPGGSFVEAEGGEAFINKKSTARFKPLLSAINAAEGGVTFQNGGVLSGGLSVPAGSGVNTFQRQQIELINELRNEVKATQALALGVRESVINMNVNLDTGELEGVQNTKIELDSAKTL